VGANGPEPPGDGGKRAICQCGMAAPLRRRTTLPVSSGCPRHWQRRGCASGCAVALLARALPVPLSGLRSSRLSASRLERRARLSPGLARMRRDHVMVPGQRAPRPRPVLVLLPAPCHEPSGVTSRRPAGSGAVQCLVRFSQLFKNSNHFKSIK
jgi:hypothetical protein